MQLSARQTALIIAPLAAKGVAGVLFFKLLAGSASGVDFGRAAHAAGLIGVATLAAGGACGPALIARAAAVRPGEEPPKGMVAAAAVIAGCIAGVLLAATLGCVPALSGAVLGYTGGAWVRWPVAAAIAGAAIAGLATARWSSGRRYGRIALAQSLGAALGAFVALPAAATGDAASAAAGFCGFPAMTGIVCLALGGAPPWCRPSTTDLRALAVPTAARLAIAAMLPVALAFARTGHATAFGWQAVALWAVAQRLAEPVGMVCGLLAAHHLTPRAAARQVGPGHAAYTQAILAAALLLPVWLGGPVLVPALFSVAMTPALAILPLFFAAEVARIAASGAGFALFGARRLAGYVAIEAAMAAAIVGLAPYLPAAQAMAVAGLAGLATAWAICHMNGFQMMKSSGPMSAGSRPASEIELKLLPSQ